jgi:dipeptidyl aminopeptidase/acylaminoacyl peptidase
MTDAFDFDAYLALPRLSGLRLSPDGKRLVVTVARPAKDGKTMHASIWELDPSGDRRPTRLTRSAPGESAGAFLRDGSLLFTSSRPDADAPDDEEDDETSRLWRLTPGAGEASVLVTAAGGIEDVVTARDADVVAFSAGVFPGTTSLAADKEKGQARKKAGVDAMLFESYPIRRWDHYLGPRDRHLFGAAVVAGEERIVSPTDLTPDAANALLETGYALTPDGSTIVTAWLDSSVLTNPRERLVAIDRASGARRTLTPEGDFWYLDPACSPDGRWVVCVRGTSSEPDDPMNQTLWLVDLASGEGRELTPDLDLWPMHPVWSVDSTAVFFTADRLGAVAVFRIEIASGEITLLSSQNALSEVCPTPDGKSLYAMRSGYAQSPHVVRLDAHAAEQTPMVVRTFAELDDPKLPGRVERIETTAADGTTIPAWLVLPQEADTTHPAPLIVWVHGGPLMSWTSWSWRWNPHLLAARGYAVLLPDPGLSSGYGQHQIGRGWGRWHEEPFTDVMASTDAALKRPDLDGSRTGLMGGSFGGYMANWVAGSTDRFKAIVTHASLWELRGFHGTTDFGSQWEREFGDPYVDAARYEAASPHRLVGNIRTPMLVIHGERDHRVPISEALRLWTDLSRHGVEAKFLYFPDENHWVLKPQNARVWYETVLAFLDQNVLGADWKRPALL